LNKFTVMSLHLPLNQHFMT